MEDIDKKLVDEYDNLEKQKKEIEEKLSNIKSEMINIAKIKGISVMLGTHKKCSIKEYDKVIYPENKEVFTKLIKNKGLYDSFSQVNYSRLSSAIAKRDISIDKDIIQAVQIIKDFRVVLIDTGM
jgi:Zn-dependent oligopeptidase